MSIDAPYLRQTLLEAASEGDIDVILETLENGASIDGLVNSVEPGSGFTALHHACVRGDIELACFLLRHGSVTDVCDKFRKTPLHYACHFGHTQVAFVLLDSGRVDVQKLYDNNEAKLTCLQTAAARGHTTILHLLLVHGDSVDGPNEAGETALHLAAAENHFDAVVVLLRCGADIAARTPQGDSPLHYACRAGAMSTASLLVRLGVSIHLTNTDDPPRSCLEMARVFGHSVLANAIIAVQMSIYLVYAASYGDTMPLL
ncbi:hypothetical protein, variant [Saprolegnia diclina VS20]|uniref:Uncharacterized protein n=1 Tax=Saprolegnia diclina (strain VS20) TaxID=1156394 RepID=T0Q760_SAPDV|nr:hypothetical protein, variant [Saprolegnia diclina VS20]EQC33709.1 hypothetical protein, variant [Saprolegnia diclina VS20]|eukprot:XP_008612932.1 hypothetical protein, variant [Saprolegnia diclina VS20]